MFNFNQLKVVNDDNAYSSFVGIRKDKDSNAMVFNLPKGFKNFEVNYNNIKTLFFRMYQTFKIFFQQKQRIQKNLIDSKPQSKDHISINNDTGVYQFTDSNNNEVLLYSKLDVLDDIIKLYNDLEIESIIQEVGLVDDIDYSKIDRLINNGVFLKNKAIVVENMVGDKNIIKGIPSDLIELYCYIYKEIMTELGEMIDDHVKEISHSFTHKHLTSVQGLFDEFTFDSTVLILKDCLDTIDKNTAYKDFMYWDIFEAIEKFLYGSLGFDEDSDKGFWGIDNFYSLWEDMCNTFYSKQENIKFIYCDTDVKLSDDKFSYLQRKKYGGISVYHDKEFINNFYIEFKDEKRWMRPDLIVQCKANGIPNKTTLLSQNNKFQ